MRLDTVDLIARRSAKVRHDAATLQNCVRTLRAEYVQYCKTGSGEGEELKAEG